MIDVVTRPGRHDSLEVAFGDGAIVSARVLTDGHIVLHCGGMSIEEMEALVGAAKAHLSSDGRAS